MSVGAAVAVGTNVGVLVADGEGVGENLSAGGVVGVGAGVLVAGRETTQAVRKRETNTMLMATLSTDRLFISFSSI